jgi:hypothetical protein
MAKKISAGVRLLLAGAIYGVLTLPFCGQICHADPPHLLGKIYCERPNTLFGYRITPLGDQNNDGYDDFMANMIVDSLRPDSTIYTISINYIYYGGNPFDSTYALKINEVGDGYNIGDVNGDGFDDIAMCGRFHSNWKTDVYFGGPSIDTIRDLCFGLDTSYPGAHPIIRGYDINSNGTDEIISYDEEHRRLLLYELGENPDSIHDLIITPANIPYDGYIFGEGLISGDFNGDSYPDLAANLRRASQQHINGSIYFYWGGPDFDTIPDLIIKRPGQYQDCYEEFGWVLEYLGDINRDGYDDFFASVGGGCYDTLSFIYFGGPLIDTIPDVIIYEPLNNARLAGDLNGDHINDLITSYPGPYSWIGDVYIYLGHWGMNSQPDWSIHNWQDTEWQVYYGLDCSGIGDFNGDGDNDFAFSAINSWSFGFIYIYSGWGDPNAIESNQTPTIPDHIYIQQNSPNPFNPVTEIVYSIPRETDVQLVIYNALGQKVRTLENEAKSAGKYTVYWDGKDDDGRTVASGIYLYKLQAGEYSSTKKMAIIR